MGFIERKYNLPVLFAADGESPRQGAFFVPNSSWTLSKIASRAYGDSSAWKIINRNQWNIDNLVYRADSTKCTSERRDSSLAVNTASPVSSKLSAYIALCSKDVKHVDILPSRVLPYPMIWIPDLAGMPMPIRQTPRGEADPANIVDDTPRQVDLDIPTGPVSPSTPSQPGTPTVSPDAGKKEKLAGMGLVLGGLAALAALVFMPAKKGKR